MVKKTQEEKELESALRKVEKLAIKTKNKLGRFDLEYTIQVSINSTRPKVVAYTAQLTPPAQHLAPVTFISYEGIDHLLTQMKAFVDDVNYDRVEVAYHQAQIVACNNTIKAHQEMIDKINGAPEDAKSDK